MRHDDGWKVKFLEILNIQIREKIAAIRFEKYEWTFVILDNFHNKCVISWKKSHFLFRINYSQAKHLHLCLYTHSNHIPWDTYMRWLRKPKKTSTSSYFYLSTQLFIRLVYTQSVFRPQHIKRNSRMEKKNNGRVFKLSFAEQFLSIWTRVRKLLKFNGFLFFGNLFCICFRNVFK